MFSIVKKMVYLLVLFVFISLIVPTTSIGALPLSNPGGGLFTDAGVEEDGAPSEPVVTRSRLVNVNFSYLGDTSGPLLDGSGVGERVPLNLFDDVVFTAVFDRAESNITGGFTWIGHLEGIDHSLVTLVVNNNVMIGKVAWQQGIYEVQFAGGDLHRVVQIQQSAFPDELTPIPVDASEPDLAAPFGITEADDGSIIDVLVMYTPEARAADGGTTAIENRIVLAVSETNTSYANSGINQRVNLVHMEETAAGEAANDFSIDLGRLQNPSDLHMDNAHTLRNTYHADHVALIIENSSSCGLAYFMSSVSIGFESSAFSVDHRTCATGYYTLGHELGHNMGATHDWYVDASVPPTNAAYTYVHGYANVANTWRTVMAYGNWCDCSDEVTPCPAYASRATPGSPSCSRLPYWSNPGVTYGGNPMGVAGGTSTSCTVGSFSPDPGTCDADNHLVLNNTASTCAQFRSSQYTWTGNTSTDWNTAGNWTTEEGSPGSTTTVNRVPRTIDDVLIPTTPVGGNWPTIASGTLNARDVLIQTGAQLNMTGGTLNVYGHWEDQGTGVFNGSGGTVAFVSIRDQTITANASSDFNNFQVGDGTSMQTLTVSSNLDINGNVTIQSGASFAGGSYTINVAGDWSDYDTSFVPNSSVVIFDGATQTIQKRSSSQVTLLSPEGFEGTFPPTGWTTQDNTGNGNWNRNDAFSGTSNQTNGTGFSAASKADSTTTPSDLDNELRSPAIVLPAGNAWLSYQSNFQDWNGNGDAWLDISTNGGTDWVNLTSWTNDHGPTSELVDLTTYAGNTINLRWRYVASTGDAWYWQIDDVEVYRNVSGWAGDLTFYDLTVNSTGSAIFNGNTAVQNDLTVNSGGVMDLSSNSATVEGTLTNNGMLRQTLDVSTGSTTEFLHIQNAAADTDKYFGVDITPASNMDATTVEIQGNQTSGCNVGDQLIHRCFDVTPTTSASATVRFWYLNGESNGESIANMNAYHWNGSTWDALTLAGTPRGTSGSYEWVEVINVSSYSPFGLTDGSPNVPTAVTLSDSNATNESQFKGLIVIATALLVVSGIFLVRINRRRFLRY